MTVYGRAIGESMVGTWIADGEAVGRAVRHKQLACVVYRGVWERREK